MDLQEDRETLKLFVDNSQLPNRVRIEGLEKLAVRLGNRILANSLLLTNFDKNEIEQIISTAVEQMGILKENRI